MSLYVVLHLDKNIGQCQVHVAILVCITFGYRHRPMLGAYCYMYYNLISTSAYVKCMSLYVVLHLDKNTGLCQVHVAIFVCVTSGYRHRPMVGACCYMYYTWVTTSANVRCMLLYLLLLDISIGLCQTYVVVCIRSGYQHRLMSDACCSTYYFG
jgi:hypothetical protein